MTFEARGVWAIVPVKRFAVAKQRLRSVLSPSECARLAETMLCDVLAALRPVPQLDGIAVVTADTAAAEIGRSFGARVVSDALEAGINVAVTQGLQAVRGVEVPVAIIPADIPFATPDDFASALTGLQLNPVVLAPAKSDGGTNLLAMRGAGLIEPSFGERSFARHSEIADAAKLTCGVYRSAGLGHDIDRPDDLMTGPGSGATRTVALLKRFKIAVRLHESEHRRLTCN